MKFAACVILYNPDQSVIQNIQSYLNYIDKLYLIDNSESINIDLQKIYNTLPHTTSVYNGINEGIAKRLNQACITALGEGFEFLLTMDQDSYFQENAIKDYFSYVASYTDEIKISMFGVNYQKESSRNECVYNTVKHLITSGSIINLYAYKQIGDFNEDLFIDFVDTDYCFRSILQGYELIEFPNIFMHHKIGTITQHRSLKNLKSTTRSIHSSTRLYYMVRNFLYMKKKYNNDFKAELLIYKKDLQNRIKNKLLYNNNRLQTFKIIIKAWKDFKQKKMGKQFSYLTKTTIPFL